MRKIIILIKICICYSCISSNSIDKEFLNKFTPQYEISYTILDSNDLYVDYIPSLHKLKNNLIFSQFTGDTIFTCINLTTHKKFNFGKRGRGPKEFTEGYALDKINDTLMFIYDRVLLRLNFFSLKNDSITYLQSSPITVFALDMFYAKDSLFFVTGNRNLKKNYALYNWKKDSLKSFISYPRGVNDNLSYIAKSRIYYSHLIRRPNSTRFLAFKDKHHIIDAIDLKDDSLILIKRNIFAHYRWKLKNGIYKPADKGMRARIFTSKLLALPNFAYALYKENNSEYILVFDWNGTPLYSYKLPVHLLHFTSDDEENFYAVALVKEKYNLIHFKLPHQ